MKKLAHLPRNAFLAALVVLAMTVWMLSGVFFSTPEEKTEEAKPETLVSVIIKPIQAESYTKTLSIVAKSAPDMEISLAAQTHGDVSKLMAKRGESVKKGDILLQIEKATRAQELAAAKATLEAARVTAHTAQELFEEGFASETRLAQALAEKEAALQAVAQIQQDISYTTVRAPINGIIEEQLVDVGDYVAVGTLLFHLVNQDKFLITGYVAQKDRKHLHLGQVAHAKLANGQEVAGEISFIASQADNTTKTFRVDLTVDGQTFTIPTGMTADLLIPTEETTAVKIEHSQLVLDTDGTIGVMLAIPAEGTTEENIYTAQFMPIKTLQDTPQGIWVEGIPAGSNLIIRGHANVTTGTRLTAKVQQEG